MQTGSRAPWSSFTVHPDGSCPPNPKKRFVVFFGGKVYKVVLYFKKTVGRIIHFVMVSPVYWSGSKRHLRHLLQIGRCLLAFALTQQISTSRTLRTQRDYLFIQDLSINAFLHEQNMIFIDFKATGSQTDKKILANPGWRRHTPHSDYLGVTSCSGFWMQRPPRVSLFGRRLCGVEALHNSNWLTT